MFIDPSERWGDIIGASQCGEAVPKAISRQRFEGNCYSRCFSMVLEEDGLIVNIASRVLCALRASGALSAL